MAVRIQARVIDRSGNALAGLVQVLPIRATPANTMMRTLTSEGMFTADTSAANAFRVTMPSGRTVMVDVSTPTPTVTSDQSQDERLRLIYAGDAAMQGQTPQSLAAAQAAEAAQANADASAARTDAAAARSTADAAQAANAALQTTLSAFTASMQLTLSTLSAALTAATARKVGLVIGRTAVPNLALNVDTPRAVTWTSPAPVVPSAAVVLLEPTGTLLGSISAAVKAGSLTTTGCEVTLRTPLALGLASGSVAVIGAYIA